MELCSRLRKMKQGRSSEQDDHQMTSLFCHAQSTGALLALFEGCCMIVTEQLEMSCTDGKQTHESSLSA